MERFNPSISGILLEKGDNQRLEFKKGSFIFIVKNTKSLDFANLLFNISFYSLSEKNNDSGLK